MATKQTFTEQKSKKRKALTLEDRIKVIKTKDGGSKVKDIMQEIDVSMKGNTDHTFCPISFPFLKKHIRCKKYLCLWYFNGCFHY